MTDYVAKIILAFHANKNGEIAKAQADYMRNKFEFFGLKSQERRTLQSTYLKPESLPPKSELSGIIKELWEQPQRELYYLGQELAKKYTRQQEPSDIELYEHMVIHNSWWDTVDFIASHLMGSYFKIYPELRYSYVDKWITSGNIWLQRSAILFQLKYKTDVDTDLLSYVIQPLLGSSEFFINKAIGWMLREYSKTNHEWVASYVSKTELTPLSRKEALRLIK